MAPNTFPAFLDRCTEELRETLPANGRSWGAARKAMNIILLHSALNKHLNDAYALDRLLHLFEVPLDASVAQGIRKESPALPRWTTIKGLTPSASEQYQYAAQSIAGRLGLPRAFLDLQYWRPGETVME